MIIVKLQGGLGNQLFQYAFGRKLSLASGQRLFLSTDSYQSDYLNRQFSLRHFPIKATVLPEPLRRFFLTAYSVPFVALCKLKLLNVTEEKDFTVQTNIEYDRLINLFYGFWQSALYFSEIRAELIKELTFSNAKLDKIRQSTIRNNDIAVHVRRSDYLLDSRYGFLGLAYYSDAIEFFASTYPNPRFIIFSDDIAWCKSNFSEFKNLLFIDDSYQLSDFEEILLMSFCSHHIVANSSFSWWGAWLCQKTDQKVVRPAVPFALKTREYENYYPSDWVPIANAWHQTVNP